MKPSYTLWPIIKRIAAGFLLLACTSAFINSSSDTCGSETKHNMINGAADEMVLVLPQILIQPVNATVGPTQDATFTVTATGESLQYQWEISETRYGPWTDLSGLPAINYSTSTLTLQAPGESVKTRFYRCRLTSGIDVIYTDVVSLSYICPPSILIQSKSENEVQYGSSVSISVFGNSGLDWTNREIWNSTGTGTITWDEGKLAWRIVGRANLYLWFPEAFPIDFNRSYCISVEVMRSNNESKAFYWGGKRLAADKTTLLAGIGGSYDYSAASRVYPTVGQWINYKIEAKTGTANNYAGWNNDNCAFYAVGGLLNYDGVNTQEVFVRNMEFYETGYGLNYQWRKDGVDINGATSPTYTIPSFSFSDAGNYTCLVSNSLGSVLSEPINVDRKAFFEAATLDEDQNYIHTRTFNTGITSEEQISTLHYDDVNESVQYYDGLGRLSQTNSIGASPLRKDIVSPVSYDEYGREAVKYLPYPLTSENHGSYFDDPLTEQADYYSLEYDGEPAYAVTIFDDSPLNRVMAQGAPGTAWQPDAHPVRYDYSANTVGDSVILWRVNINDSLIKEGYYNQGMLYKTIVRDENWDTLLLHSTEEYKDFQGNVVLKRSYVKDATQDTIPVETYYVYDDFGLLRYVIPPLAVQNLGEETSFDQWQPLIKNLCYYYQFDARKRMIIKQMPGAGPVHLVYDRRDRLIATQDSVQRESFKWLVTKYDQLNRPVMTGLKIISSETRSTLQGYLDTCTTPGNFYESRIATGVGYTLDYSFAVKFSMTESDLLTVTYYDTYDYPESKPFNINVRVSDYYDSYADKYFSERTKSLVTGTKVKVLDGTEHNLLGYKWLTSTIYYDDKYQPIQMLRDLFSTVSTDNEVVSTLFDFVGKTLQTMTRQVFNGNTNTVIETNTYDHAGRLLQVKHQLNSNPEVILASMEYNELGQLKRKALHGDISNGMQEINYEYNIRGWLTAINDPSVNPSTYSTNKFNMQLFYDSIPSGLIANAQYNGNISAMVWSTPLNLYVKNQGGKQGYGFVYDALNRLLDANYAEGADLTSNAGIDNESYSYDLNGNIKTLKRYMNIRGMIDNLTYYYKNDNKSNCLDRVDDLKGAYGFYNNGVYQANEYSFDGNGSLVADVNRGYTDIQYNYLNLPKKVGTSNEYIKYIYDALGNKLAKVSTSSIYTYYPGNFVYEGNSLSYILHPEGFLIPETGYRYNLTDHLGNIRLVLASERLSGMIYQQTDYYPSGLIISEQYGYKYRYNGKEMQEDLLNARKLEWYDYGARFYDPQIGRWHVSDPLAEQAFDWSPYRYGFDNPISTTDPNGMLEDWVKDDGQWKWDERVKSEADAKKYYGDKAEYGKPGETHYWANDGREVALQDQGKWSYTGQTRGDPDCPSCGLNNGNTGWLEQFQAGVQSYQPLLKAAEISLTVSAALLSGEIGAGASFASKGVQLAKGTQLAEDVAKTFQFRQYTEITLDQTIKLSRYYDNVGAFAKGRFFTNSVSNSTLIDRVGLGIRPAWNSMTKVAHWEVPAGTTVFKGRAAMQFPWIGGKTQYFIPELSSLKRVIR